MFPINPNKISMAINTITGSTVLVISSERASAVTYDSITSIVELENYTELLSFLSQLLTRYFILSYLLAEILGNVVY